MPAADSTPRRPSQAADLRDELLSHTALGFSSLADQINQGFSYREEIPATSVLGIFILTRGCPWVADEDWLSGFLEVEAEIAVRQWQRLQAGLDVEPTAHDIVVRRRAAP